MKAVVYTRYGPPSVLGLADVKTPVPGDNQVLVKVHAVSLNASSWEVLRGKPLFSRIGGPLRPRHHVLGSDIVGRVAAAGRHATRSYHSQPKLKAMRSGGAISVNPSSSCLPKPWSETRNTLMPHMLWVLRPAEPGKGPACGSRERDLYGPGEAERDSH